jgi:hypothetical protein
LGWTPQVSASPVLSTAATKSTATHATGPSRRSGGSLKQFDDSRNVSLVVSAPAHFHRFRILKTSFVSMRQRPRTFDPRGCARLPRRRQRRILRKEAALAAAFSASVDVRPIGLAHYGPEPPARAGSDLFERLTHAPGRAPSAWRSGSGIVHPSDGSRKKARPGRHHNGHQTCDLVDAAVGTTAEILD